MGYDISYHPIAVKEMKEWYFDMDLNKIREEDFSEVLKVAEAHNIDEFYIEKYKESLSVAADTDENSNFDTSHGYLMAVIQGFFRKYFYTRSTAFSFLLKKDSNFAKYLMNWDKIVDKETAETSNNKIITHYSSGVYISPEGVSMLLTDYEKDEKVKKLIDSYYKENTSTLLKALNYAKDKELGLLEACEVVEPNPLDLDDSTSYSNLFNCDPEGVRVFYQTVQAQLAELANEQGIAAEDYIEKVEEKSKEKKQSFWKKLFPAK